MNIIVNIDKNTLANKQPKIYDLGEVTTSIQDLLDNSTITITNDRLVILRFTDLDLSVKQGFLNLNNYTEGDKYGLGQNILESDLIYFSSGGSGDSRPYKVYTALLTQSGTNAPVATVLENTLNGNVTFSFISTGIYEITIPVQVNYNKVFILCPSSFRNKNAGVFSDVLIDLPITTNNFKINVKELNFATNYLNSMLDKFPIEIRVYN